MIKTSKNKTYIRKYSRYNKNLKIYKKTYKHKNAKTQVRKCKSIKSSNINKYKSNGGAGGISNQERQIKHFWYKSWPDKGVPDDNVHDIFIKFIDMLLNDINTNKGGTVIHCSAGVGRTGVMFVILKICLDKNNSLTELRRTETKTEGQVELVCEVTHEDIINAITYARMRRMLMVQTYEQYVFILKMFNLKETDTCKTAYNNINKSFTDLTTQKCTDQNRYGDILPYEETRVKLNDESTNDDCESYINASYLNCSIDIPKETNETKKFLYKASEGILQGIIIGAQGPTSITQQNFLKMLALPNLDIKRIIMVTGLNEGGNVKCNDYTSSKVPSNQKLLTLTNTDKGLSNAQYGNGNQYKLVSGYENITGKNKYNLVFDESLNDKELLTTSDITDKNIIHKRQRLKQFLLYRPILDYYDVKLILLYILIHSLMDNTKIANLIIDPNTNSQILVDSILQKLTIKNIQNFTYTKAKNVESFFESISKEQETPYLTLFDIYEISNLLLIFQKIFIKEPPIPILIENKLNPELNPELIPSPRDIDF